MSGDSFVRAANSQPRESLSGAANSQPRAGRHFTGAQFALDKAAIDRWVAGAAKGDSLIYCAAPELIRGEASVRVRELAADGVVRAHQSRRAGGGWEFLVVRTGYALRDSRRAPSDPLDAAGQAILAAMKRAVNLCAPCPTNAELAKLAGLESRDQAAARVRKLVQRGLIASEQVTEDGVTTRIVTIVGADGVARSSLPPPKHRAALKAIRATMEDAE